MAKFSTDGKYLKHTDLDDINPSGDVIVTIRSYRSEMLEKGESKQKKWVLYFDNLDKGLALNATNGNCLCKLLGNDDMDTWVGKSVSLYVKDDVEFAGEIVSAIRVRPRLPHLEARK